MRDTTETRLSGQYSKRSPGRGGVVGGTRRIGRAFSKGRPSDNSRASVSGRPTKDRPIGSAGSAVVDVGPGDRFFVVSGRNGYVEGALGSDSDGVPYPGPPAIGPCYLPQRTGGVCP